MKDIYDMTSNAIRAIREDNKLTQKELAEAICVDRATLANIELCNQRPTLQVIYGVANFLDIELTDILPDRDQFIKEDTIKRRALSKLSVKEKQVLGL